MPIYAVNQLVDFGLQIIGNERCPSFSYDGNMELTFFSNPFILANSNTLDGIAMDWTSNGISRLPLSDLSVEEICTSIIST